jgi:hypothetical protein
MRARGGRPTVAELIQDEGLTVGEAKHVQGRPVAVSPNLRAERLFGAAVVLVDFLCGDAGIDPDLVLGGRHGDRRSSAALRVRARTYEAFEGAGYTPGEITAALRELRELQKETGGTARETPTDSRQERKRKGGATGTVPKDQLQRAKNLTGRGDDASGNDCATDGRARRAACVG